ncbi:MAG: hypothetical protein AABZ30_10665 [Myxococcota bacterium]
MPGHPIAEQRSIELHRAVAERLRREPALIARAGERVRGWRETGAVAAMYADAWTRLLALPLDELCAFLVDSSERARALRQVTPFAGVVDPRTRWRIWRDVRARFGQGA